MQQTFRRRSDNSIILQIKANIPQGQAHARDGTLRHALHPTGIGVLTELESLTPSPRRTDRQTRLDIPLAIAAELTIMFDMRDALYGIPVRWENSLQAAIDVIILSVESKAYPGVGALLNTRFRASLLIQPA